MSDVITNAHSSVTTIVNGAAIVHVKKTGEYESHSSDITTLNIPSGTLFTRLDTRFDDVRYYTGDTVN
jgi:hypothetical protein|tara:strand:+ start:487 stop:690 length:204 start_codon:yes stop_codon:yes gene_type:complete